jgi:hypothetical protein
MSIRIVKILLCNVVEEKTQLKNSQPSRRSAIQYFKNCVVKVKKKKKKTHGKVADLQYSSLKIV